MLVDRLEAEPTGDGRVRRSLRLRYDSGEEVVCPVVVPEDCAPRDADDATGPLPLAILLAMHAREDLVVEGRVSARLLARVEWIVDTYRAFEPSLHPTAVRVAGVLDRPAGEGPRRTGAFLSRGMDSMFCAAYGQALDGPIDELVFVDRIEPVHGDATRLEELRLAREVAEVLGKPLVVVEANPRALVDGRRDWEDGVSAGMAWIAHALAGRFECLVLAPTDALYRLGFAGHSLLLDRLFGSESMTLEHGDVLRRRVEKVEWLAEHAPRLLPYLKTCFAIDDAGNCGRCPKCLWAMAALRAVGALEAASAFPPKLDLDLLESLHAAPLTFRFGWPPLAEAAERHGDHELAAAVRRALARAAREAPVVPSRELRSFRTAYDNYVISAVLDGSPDREAGDTISHADPWSQPSAAQRVAVQRVAAPAGLLRGLDVVARRHRYAAGRRPQGELVGELGALVPHGAGGEVPVWIDADGGLRTPAWPPREPPAPGAGARARHVASPLAWRGDGPLPGRVRVAAQRALDLGLRAMTREAAVRSGATDETDGAQPDGWLYAEAGDGRLALYGAVHPVTGDQLLSTERWEPVDAGFAGVTLLGYLRAEAPVTGLLGLHRLPAVPWASRLGRRWRAG